MKEGAEEERKRLIAIVLGCCALGGVAYTLYNQLGGSSTAPPVASAPVVAPASAKTVGFPVAVKLRTDNTQLDPTLHTGPMLVTESLVYMGTGRNIFSSVTDVPVPAAPRPIAPARIQTVAAAPPPPPPQLGPPPAPPINLKFFGTATSESGIRRAFLLNGDDVFIASIGDVVSRKYRVISISATSIQVEDMPNSNRQTLPLVP